MRAREEESLQLTLPWTRISYGRNAREEKLQSSPLSPSQEGGKGDGNSGTLDCWWVHHIKVNLDYRETALTHYTLLSKLVCS